MNQKIRLLCLLGITMILFFIAFSFPRTFFGQEAIYGFNYFEKISAEGQHLELDITVLDALKESSRASASIRSFLLLDDQLFSYDTEFQIKINDVPVSLLDLDCDLYPRTCAVQIPLDLLETKSTFEIQPDLYMLKKSDTFFGILLRFGISKE